MAVFWARGQRLLKRPACLTTLQRADLIVQYNASRRAWAADRAQRDAGIRNGDAHKVGHLLTGSSPPLPIQCTGDIDCGVLLIRSGWRSGPPLLSVWYDIQCRPLKIVPEEGHSDRKSTAFELTAKRADRQARRQRCPSRMAQIKGFYPDRARR